MKSVSGKRLAKLAEEHGWKLARVAGSHHVYVRAGQVERLHLHPSTVGRKAVGHFGVFQRVSEAKIWPMVLNHIEAKVPLLRKELAH